MMHRIAFGLLASSAWMLAAADRVAAQIYPEHPIKIIVSSAAGGPLDIVGRAVADKLAASLNRTWPGEWPGAASTESLLVTS